MRRLVISVVLLWCVVGCGLILPRTTLSDAEVVFNAGGDSTLVSVSPAEVFSDETIFDLLPGKSGHHAATITAFEDGELLVGWYSYDGPDELAGSAIYMSRREAGEARWSEPRLHIDRKTGDGNPVLYSEGDRVWLFQAVVPFGWATSHIEMQRSTDRGLTWSGREVVSLSIGSNVRYAPVRTSEGELLLGGYDELFLRSVFFASVDGVTWRFRSSISTQPGNIQPSMVGLSDGRLLVVMRNVGGDWLWVTTSGDSGRSWSKPVDSGFANPNSASALVRLSSGRLVLVFNDSGSERRPLSIALSADDGRTWPYRRVIADGRSTYSYPSVVQAPDGLVHIVYSHDRSQIRHVTLNEAWVVSSGDVGVVGSCAGGMERWSSAGPAAADCWKQKSITKRSGVIAICDKYRLIFMNWTSRRILSRNERQTNMSIQSGGRRSGGC